MTSADPGCQITILGDLKVHSKSWLLNSSDTPTNRCEAEAFAIITNLCQLTNFPTRNSDFIGDRAQTLDLILAILSSLVSLLSLLSSQKHYLPFFSLSFIFPSPTLDSPFEAMTDDCDSLRDFPTCYPWNDRCFLSNVSLSVSSFAETVLQGMHPYIPQFSEPDKPQSLSGLTTHAVVRSCGKLFTSGGVARPTRHRFVQARNKCPLAIQDAGDRFLRQTAEWLASSATGCLSFQSLSSHS